MTRWLSPDEQRFWRTWLATMASVQDAIEADFARHDLLDADYEILAHLSEAPGGRMRMTQLANTVLFSKSRVTYRITQLEARGFVERRPCDGDARGVEALLTRAGRRFIERIAPAHVETVRAALVDHLRPATMRAFVADLAPIVGEGHGAASVGSAT